MLITSLYYVKYLGLETVCLKFTTSMFVNILSF